ncbi:MAG: hypothetical protein U1E25_00905 [Methylocystis sp.]
MTAMMELFLFPQRIRCRVRLIAISRGKRLPWDDGVWRWRGSAAAIKRATSAQIAKGISIRQFENDAPLISTSSATFPSQGGIDLLKKAKVMSRFYRHDSLLLGRVMFKQTVLALGFSLLASQSLAQRAATGGGPFAGMSGHWSGVGSITMANGATERIRCRATYAVHPAGTALNQSLRCASDSYRLEISANVLSQGGAISGSWSESTHGVSGSISGRATGADIQAHVSGAGFAANIGIRTHGNSQTVGIRPQAGTDVSAVSITLRKG